MAEEHEMTETERCCALLEAVLEGLEASNGWAVNQRPDWEIEMVKPSGEERRFTVLLEQVKHEFNVLAEGLADVHKKLDGLQKGVDHRVRELDVKIERVAKELSGRMDVGFATVMKELRNHNHSGK